jgi:DNA-binding response OmpR family regulator
MGSTANGQESSRLTSGAGIFSQPPQRILIAEDSADSREMLQVLLEGKGYEVISVGDGYLAVEAALRQRPNLILVDLQLPGLDGLSVAKELRLHSELERTPIIIISGHDPSRYRDQALTAGCDDYLLKPIDFERLDEILIERIPLSVLRAHTA